MEERQNIDPERDHAESTLDRLRRDLLDGHVDRCLRLACGDPVRGVDLIAYNTRASEALRSAASSLETTLRARFHRELAPAYGEHWMLDERVVTSRLCQDMAASARKSANRAAGRAGRAEATPEEILGWIPFGFWTNMLSEPQAGAWTRDIHRVFGAGPGDAGREALEADLRLTQGTRNVCDHPQYVLDLDLKGRHEAALRVAEKLSPAMAEAIRLKSGFPAVHPFEDISYAEEPPKGTRDRVLQLACAVTKRIGASYPLDSAVMCVAIEKALLYADARDAVPEGQVAERASAIARARARCDVTATVARETSRRMSRSGTPNVAYELDARSGQCDVFHMTHVQERYEADLHAELARVEDSVVTPTPLETTVARLAIAAEHDADASDFDRERMTLAGVLELALSRGSVTDVDALKRERTEIVPELAKSMDGLLEHEKLAMETRIYRSLTIPEIEATCRGLGAHMMALPDAQARSRVLANLKELHAREAFASVPWRSLRLRHSLSMSAWRIRPRTASIGAERA